MESKLETLSRSVVIADLNDEHRLDDLITVLSAYKVDEMGQYVPYYKEEIDQLKVKLTQQKSMTVFLLYIDSQIAGAAVCFESMSTFSAKSVINIHDLCILKEFRREGFGRDLMNTITSYAGSLDCSKVTLEVREDNIVARKLYRSLGFSESTPVMNFWSKSLN